MSTIACDDLPLPLLSWLSANGLQSPLSVASVVDGGLISIHPLSFRSSQSFRVANSKQCIFEVTYEDDEETLRNVNTDGRVTLQFEVLPTTSSSPFAPIPACQLVKIQGTGLVHERGSSAYNAILNPPPSSTMNQWYPRAVVAVSVQRVLLSHAGPGLSSPIYSQPTSTVGTGRSSLREAPSSRSRRSASRNHQSDFGANWGWPTGGDSCCAT